MIKVNRPVVAIAGYAGAGKSTASRYFKEFGSKTFSFAAPIKEILSRVYDIPIEIFSDPVQKLVPHENLNGLTPRRAMQLIGTEGFRNLIDVDTWTKCFERDAAKFIIQCPEIQLVVVDDLRFLTEKSCIDRHQSTAIYINNPKVVQQYNHQSEAELEQIRCMPDVITINNDGTFDQLFARLAEIPLFGLQKI